jgi:predicted amidohydrolase
VFKLAMIQMRVVGGDKAANLASAERLIAEAVTQGAQVVLLPEALNLGWTHPSARTDADPIPGGTSYTRLAEAARRHHVHLCAGLIERDGPDLFNSAVLLNPEGQLLLHHRKLNELEIAHDLYAQGSKAEVARTPLGTFGVMICSDAFATGQPISRSLAWMGADVILSPCSWAVPADHDNARDPYGSLWLESYGPVTREFQIWIAGVSNVGPIPAGPWAGRKCIGCSLLMNPQGEPALTGPYGVNAETILFADIEPVPRPTRGDGWRTRLS